MSREPQSLDADVLAVLRAAKPMTEAPSDARARILSAVEARIALLPSGGPHGQGGAGPGNAGPGGAPSGAPIGRGGWIASHPVLALAGAFVAGGAASFFARGAPAERVVYVDRVVTTEASAPPPIALPPAPREEVSASAAIPVRPAPEASVAPARPSAAPLDSAGELAAERALLDTGRTALARGEADHALAAVQRHATQFPYGVLSEEREALAVKALVLAGRGDDARARAERFHTRYPESIFSTAIDSSVKSIH